MLPIVLPTQPNLT